jgi:hypothetical protein
MPLLTPNLSSYNGSFENDGDNCEIEIGEVLAEANLVPEAEGDDRLKKTLNYCGASVENAGRTIADVLKNARFDSNKLRAAELILDLHGVRDKEGQIKKQPIFQFFIRDSGVQINPVFSPLRAIANPNSNSSEF